MEILESVKQFILVKEVSVWQELFWSTLLIPCAIFLALELKEWWVKRRPLNLLLKDFRESRSSILVFLAQLSQADGAWNRIGDPKYIQPYPCPTPSDHGRVCFVHNLNIDPVWSETNGLCATEVFKTLGRANIVDNVKIAHTINDWNTTGSPIISIGFNAKTIMSLESQCRPISYRRGDASISMEGCCSNGNPTDSDMGIIQKTIMERTATPVLILAGMGTTATAAAGLLFREKAVALGKLYGNRPFCILFGASGRSDYAIRAVYPRPPARRAVLYPRTYFSWYRKGLLP